MCDVKSTERVDCEWAKQSKYPGNRKTINESSFHYRFTWIFKRNCGARSEFHFTRGQDAPTGIFTTVIKLLNLLVL